MTPNPENEIQNENNPTLPNQENPIVEQPPVPLAPAQNTGPSAISVPVRADNNTLHVTANPNVTLFNSKTETTINAGENSTVENSGNTNICTLL